MEKTIKKACYYIYAANYLSRLLRIDAENGGLWPSDSWWKCEHGISQNMGHYNREDFVCSNREVAENAFEKCDEIFEKINSYNFSANDKERESYIEYEITHGLGSAEDLANILEVKADRYVSMFWKDPGEYSEWIRSDSPSMRYNACLKIQNLVGKAFDMIDDIIRGDHNLHPKFLEAVERAIDYIEDIDFNLFAVKEKAIRTEQDYYEELDEEPMDRPWTPYTQYL